MLITKDATGRNWAINAGEFVPMKTSWLLCNKAQSEMVHQQKSCTLVTARWEQGYTITLLSSSSFCLNRKEDYNLKTGKQRQRGATLLYILGARTEWDLRPMYYTTVISQLLESIKGLSKREFVIARKEEARRHDEGSRLSIPCPCLPGHRQKKALEWVWMHVRNACVHIWAIWENEHEGLEIKLFQIKSPSLFIRSYTEFCCFHFLQHTVTNVGRTVHQPFWQALEKWQKYLQLGGHSPIAKILFQSIKFSGYQTLLCFWWNTIPYLLQCYLSSPFYISKSKRALDLTWKTISVKLQLLTSVTPLGQVQDIGNKLCISAYSCLAIWFVLSFSKRLLVLHFLLELHDLLSEGAKVKML